MASLVDVAASTATHSGRFLSEQRNRSSRDSGMAVDAHMLRHGSREWSFWTGVSFDSPSGSFLGETKDRAFFMAGFQHSRILAASRKVAFAYTLEVIPVAVVTNNPDTTTTLFRDGRIDRRIDRSSVYGVGLAPIGMKTYLFPESSTRFFFSASAGFLSFLKAVPVPNARKFNFAFDFGAGIQIATSRRTAMTIGYRLHHLSNANTADLNPGLDSNIFYFGLSLIK
ncbi:acyloxyacyl hydrolase [bacterium]|nr:acyloxyacyl hydrolase [bacterium]